MNPSKTLNQNSMTSQDMGKTKTVKSKLNEKPVKQEKTIEEKIIEIEISAVENSRLKAVFQLLCCGQQDTFGAKELYEILKHNLQYTPARGEIEQMIWEVDEDLDGRVSEYEFELMYKRCIKDTTGLEPRNLFNLVQFLMYDKGNKFKITVEDTLELLYVRFGRGVLDTEIEAIFGKEEKTQDGQEKEIHFTEYVQKMKKRDFETRLALEKLRKTVKPIPQEENK